MKLYIHIDNPSMTFRGGETVTGQVVVELENDEKTSGLTLRCLGDAEVHWAGSDNKLTKGSHDLIHNIHVPGLNKEINHHESHSSLNKHSTAREKYFDYNILLYGHADGFETTIQAGVHEYPFTFDLPHGIPSSFQGKHGTVQYLLEARIKRHTHDYDANVIFYVIGELDLNAFPLAVEYVEVQEEKELGCLCFKKGVLGFSLKLNHTGFVPGETISCTANLFNMTSKVLPVNCIRLVQTTLFHVGLRSKSYDEIILERNGPSLQPGETKVWEETGVIVPDLPPTKLGGCKIIGLEYALKMMMQNPHGKDLSAIVPIVVGTTPFQNNLIEEIENALSFEEIRSLGIQSTISLHSINHKNMSSSEEVDDDGKEV